LVALSDGELEKVDIVEMNVAVAREIPGLEKLEYGRYGRIVDGWAEKFRRWLPTVEHAFLAAPAKYKNDINFFRLGMLGQFLDTQVGIAYVEEQKRTQAEARKAGRHADVFYTDPGHLLLHGLIDTRRGTCATMPALHVAIGRRLGWPVGLACANSHYVCRYDDGKVVYNIEATDTGHGGFAAGSDEDYLAKEGVSRKAIAVGSDLRKLTAREMLGVFVQSRARHYADTGKARQAAQDYALAYALFPNSRKAYMGLFDSLMECGEKLFGEEEAGHPAALAASLAGRYQPPGAGLAGPRAAGADGRSPLHRDPLEDIDRINAINRANMERLAQPPGFPQSYQPPVPGLPPPPQPNR
jgi:hypothetical protein